MLKTSPVFGALIIALIELLYRYHSSWGIVVLIAIAMYVYLRWFLRAELGEETRNVESIALLVYIVALFGALYGMTIELAWLRHVCAFGIGLFVAYTGSSLSILRGDIRGLPPMLVSHTTFLAGGAMVLTGAFIHAYAAQSQVVLWFWLGVSALAQSAIFFLAGAILHMTLRRRIRMWAVIALITFEGAWVLAFLPFGSFTRALLLGIPSILWFSIERDRLLDMLEPKRVLRWGSIGLMLIFVLLATTRWS